MKTPPKEEEVPHPTKSHSSLFWDDCILRNHGFSILQRRKENEPVWERKGERFLQSEALSVVEREQALLSEKKCSGKGKREDVP